MMPPNHDTSQPQALDLSRSQRAVVDALRRRESAQYPLSQWYLGALYALANPHNPDRFSQAAQSLRELMEKLPRVVSEASAVQRTRPNFPEIRSRLRDRITHDLTEYADGWEEQFINTHLAETLDQTVDYLGQDQGWNRSAQIQVAVSQIDPMDDEMDNATRRRRVRAIANAWDEMEGFAHHRPCDPETFNQHLAALERVILDLLAPVTAQNQEEIQSILNDVDRSTDNENRIFELIGRRGANYRFFFTQASDPTWVPVLRERGYFANPPSVEELDDGRVIMPSWWPMIYLSKVAPSVPDEAVAVVQALPHFDNPRIYESILEMALLLPGEHSVQLRSQIRRYERISTDVLPHRMPDLVVHWANEGQTQAALDLATKIVRFNPDPEQHGKEALRRDSPDDWTAVLRPKPRLEPWHYVRFMANAMRNLADSEPYAVARALISAVNGLMYNRQYPGGLYRNGDEDRSQITHPRLDGPVDEALPPSGALVFAMTYACRRVWEHDPDSVADLDQLLRSRHWRIFRRLRHHLYSLYPNEQSRPWIRDALMEHMDYSLWEYHYEFQQMVSSACQTFGQELLDTEELTLIFDQIRNGPDQDAYRRAMGEHYTQERFERRRSEFQRKQFRPFQPVLFGDYLDHFQTLEQENGSPIVDEDYMPFGPMRSTMVSRRSPRPAAELAGLEDEELLAYINHWENEHPDSEDWSVEITIEALSETFATLFRDTLSADAGRLDFWLENRHRIERPIYVRAIVNSMSSRIEEQDFDHLDRWLEFCDWVLTHPDREHVISLHPSDQCRGNPYWGDCRRSVLDLLRALLSTCLVNDTPLPGVALDRLPDLLGRMCVEFDWSLDENQRALPERGDWMTEAMSNTRSRALADLFRFGRLLIRDNRQADLTIIEDLLERRFNQEAEHPLTLPESAMLGRAFVEALTMDGPWTVMHLDDFFPQDRLDHWIASFGAFLEHHGPDPHIFEIMGDHLNFAAHRLPELAEAPPLVDVLGQKLLSYYALGMFPLHGDDSPLEAYYCATNHRRRHWANLLENTGWRLYHFQGEMTETVRERYLSFFEWRLEAGDPVELSNFDSWLEANCLDVTWRLYAYSRALEACQFDVGSWHNWAPIAEMLPENIALVVECFAKLVDACHRDGNLFCIFPEPAKRILTAGLASADPIVRQDAARARETLLASGRFDVVDLDV